MNRFQRIPNVLGRAILCVLLAVPSLPASADTSSVAEQLQQAADLLNSRDPGQRDQAHSLLRGLAEAGQADAAALLAYALYYGLLTSAETDAPLSWWQRAAELGDRDAAFNLGLVLLRAGDVSMALVWLQQAADSGDLLAAFVLGTSLAERAEPADQPRARRWLEVAAAGAYAPAQYNLATLLTSHDATTADHQAARQWLEAAASTFQPARDALAGLNSEISALPQPRSESEPRPARGLVHDIAWLRQQTPDTYTIQVAAGHSVDAITRLLKRYSSHEDAAWFLHRPHSKEPYSAIVGVYDSFSEAEQALAKLPDALRNNAPWIRRFAVLQQELRRVEQGQPAAPASASPPGS